MSYKLTVTSRAKQDRDNALEWFRINYSQAYAARWYEGIAQAVESLRENPMRCHKAHESGRFPSMFSNYFTDQSAISIASFSESSAIAWSCSIFAIRRNKIWAPRTFKSFQYIPLL